MVNTSNCDAKVQKILEESKVSREHLNYIENFVYPHVNDVQLYYEQLLKIGQGTFGEVFKARCKRTGSLVALKKILMENEKEGFPITALREIKMLRILRHPNITELIEVCTCKQKSTRERFAFYLVFTFCEHDLAGLLSNQRIKFNLVQIKTMAQHILRGLCKIHKQQILHRDMKSANVLITSDGVLKLADFGLARLMIKQQGYCYTNRVVTLWYRPPELLLGSRYYGPTIDIWGAGCIVAELWIRSPILQGNTEQEQLDRISKLCGSINHQTWPGCESLPYYSNLQAALPQSYTRRVRERIGPFLQQNDQALALIDQMLTLNPEKRPSAELALDHNFFYELPLPAPNIKDLVDQLKGVNLFEYTAGCGAHANRKRPIAPAAPPHGGPVQQQHPIRKQPRFPVPPPNQQQTNSGLFPPVRKQPQQGFPPMPQQSQQQASTSLYQHQQQVHKQQQHQQQMFTVTTSNQQNNQPIRKPQQPGFAIPQQNQQTTARFPQPPTPSQQQQQNYRRTQQQQSQFFYYR